MILKEVEQKAFDNHSDKIKWLVENKESLINSSKGEYKTSDCISINLVDNKDLQVSSKEMANDNEIVATIIVNTTNILDSHGDVHIPGIWDKCLAENGRILHLQEHKMEFDKIIADKEDINVYVKMFSWRELGYNADGDTQALVFESKVKKERNEFMFNQYSKGYVKNHSVRMQYVNIDLAVNDPEYKEEFAVWNKYIDTIANKSHTESLGYFWAVTEAKVFEGSAVPIGSNPITPTISLKEYKNIDISNEKDKSDITIVVNEDEYYKLLHKLRANKIKILK